ncbi:MAG: hypothetical protein AB1Z51_13785, partial [Desulfuromonadales bacterium]
AVRSNAATSKALRLSRTVLSAAHSRTGTDRPGAIRVQVGQSTAVAAASPVVRRIRPLPRAGNRFGAAIVHSARSKTPWRP